MTSSLGPVRQVGYVVADLKRATTFWLEVMGVGPFFQLPSYEVANCRFGGAQSSPRLDVAISYSAGLQIELLQPLDEQPSLYRELLQSRHDGPHYVTYWVDDLAAAMQPLQQAGAEVIQSGGAEGAGRFAYLKLPGQPLFELLETSPMIRGWFGGMQEAAASWNGERPLRPAFG
jgi:catechol 2,3-dioxygenase-like lactoylglutathione lyase family enzyme